MTQDERRQARQAVSWPLWEELQTWLRLQRSKVLDDSKIAEAIDYSLRRPSRQLHCMGRQASDWPGQLFCRYVSSSGLQELGRKHGWVVELGINTQSVLNKLVGGRGIVAILPDILMSTQPEEVLGRIKRLTPPALESWYFSAASKDFASRYPRFLSEYWVNMCKAGRAYQTGKPPCRGARHMSS